MTSSLSFIALLSERRIGYFYSSSLLEVTAFHYTFLKNKTTQYKQEAPYKQINKIIIIIIIVITPDHRALSISKLTPTITVRTKSKEVIESYYNQKSK